VPLRFRTQSNNEKTGTKTKEIQGPTLTPA
jgi:hypothetical protein